MKKIITLLTVLSLFITLLFTSCTPDSDTGGDTAGDGGSADQGGSNEDNGNGNGDGKDYSSYVFAKDTPPTLVFADGVPTEARNLIYNELRDALGAPPKYLFGADGSTGKHEIVIGDLDLAISRSAKRKLQTLKTDDDYTSTYIIYASGSSVAIVFEEKATDVVALEAVSYFTENYVKGKEELKLGSGTVASKSISILDHYAKLDEQSLNKAYLALENAVGGAAGKALAEAIRDLYAIHDPKVVSWFANLYDPGVGGFYFSNSARDIYGFLPDAESTGQALGFVNACGMLYGTVYESYADVLSDEMKSALKTFLRSLQDPNGYFYHPQWTRVATEANPSRMARDMSYAVGVLQALGSGPVYDTPTGIKGDGLPVSHVVLTPPLTSSSAVSAASVALLASHSPNFESLETLRSYLDGLLASGKHFYPIGNEVGSQISQIIERDKELGTYRTDQSLVKFVIDWFNSYQDPTNGTWDKDGGYDGVNALLKISALYNNAGFPMNYPEQAAKSAMAAIGSDVPINAIVDIYNTWYAVGNVIKNLRSYGSEGSDAKADEILSELRAIAPTALEDTANKLKLFAISDGSYSYYPDKGCNVSQGMPVADSDLPEGTVNSTVIATNSITGVIYYALELSSYQVPIFGQKELYIFLNTVNSLEPVYKEAPPSPEDLPYFDFEDDSVGSAPSSVTSNNDGSLKVVKDDEAHKNVLEYTTSAGKGDYAYIPTEGQNNGSAYIFEADVKFLSEGKNDYRYAYQVFLDSACLLQFEQIDGKMKLREATTASATTAIYNDLISLEFDRWYSLRVEYYVGSTDSVRIKIYVDGDLISISDNYYNKTKDVQPTPYNTGITKVSFYAMNSLSMSVRLDNLRYVATSDTYTPATEADTKIVYNVDAKK